MIDFKRVGVGDCAVWYKKAQKEVSSRYEKIDKMWLLCSELLPYIHTWIHRRAYERPHLESRKRVGRATREIECVSKHLEVGTSDPCYKRQLLYSKRYRCRVSIVFQPLG